MLEIDLRAPRGSLPTPLHFPGEFSFLRGDWEKLGNLVHIAFVIQFVALGGDCNCCNLVTLA